MYIFTCMAGNYSILCFAKEQASLKSLVRRGVKACMGAEGAAYVLREFPSDYDTKDAQEIPWIDGKDFILLDEQEVMYVEGMTHDIEKGVWK